MAESSNLPLVPSVPVAISKSPTFAPGAAAVTLAVTAPILYTSPFSAAVISGRSLPAFTTPLK